MKIKSYFANTVESAMAQARQELGPEAMLVNSRNSSLETRHLGAYEVVFVTDVPPGESQETPAAPVRDGAPAGDRLTRQMAELKRELEGMRRTFTRSALAPAAWRDSSADASDAYNALAAGEVSPELAREIVQGAESRIARSSPGKTRPGFRGALMQELEARIKVQPVLGRGESRPRIVALVGPPGCGKTTTLVKLAVNYGLAARRPVMLLSFDNYRVAAAEQLRSYSAILGVGFQLVETVTALAQAIEENRGKELIFLDTPGLGAGDMADYSSLAQFLSTREDIDTHLAVSCSMKSADLSRVVDGFEVFRPQRLLFTRADETGSFGPILNESVRTGKPISFFATGQRIPEDLEAATASRVAEWVLSGTNGQALSAA
ncbi:MAG TPA: flagellar biosynthesis protein FlhF [Bryobacteraceae bacterium]|jgi:flagellar biosynthesis protein FlhF|nr:flagellar biosynthesis protein FlhF [Bryobacteraceae bacterium]